VTSGRFHVGDLARELTRLGLDVTFYSLLPASRTTPLGLDPRKCRWLWAAMPAWLLHRAARSPASERVLAETIDRAAAASLEPCDALIIMSGMALRTIARAKRLGARTFVERSSRHIRSQKEILAKLAAQYPEAGVRQVDDWILERELAEYALADEVVVPSRQAEDSFPAERLFRNPFGTNLAQFHPTSAPPPSPPRFVMAGAWSYEKGVDVLVEAWPLVRRALPTAELHHVGPVIDAPVPTALAGFTHEDKVPQPALLERYARAHVFVLASRQEGLAVVQAQAMASGLRLVCTDRTGGADLAELAETPVHVVPSDQPVALADALIAAYEAVKGGRDALGDRLSRLSWAAYAERWRSHLEAVCR
jgi:glycosyltransferase involved in cell wall biosynthesis